MDGRNGRTDGRTDGRCQNYIPPTSSGDNKTQINRNDPQKKYRQGNLSMVHYNVQSFASKTGIIKAELTYFDSVSLIKTRFNDSISNDDLKFYDFQDPFRRDRIVDSHSGIIVYVKCGIPSKCRLD